MSSSLLGVVIVVMFMCGIFWMISLRLTRIYMRDMFPWLMVTIWRRCPSIFLLFLVYLIICFRVYFDLASAIIWMKIGVVNGVIMSLCRLLQTRYALVISHSCSYDGFVWCFSFISSFFFFLLIFFLCVNLTINLACIIYFSSVNLYSKLILQSGIK